MASNQKITNRSLCSFVEQQLGRNSKTGEAFIFVNRSRTLAKVLWWDRTGWCLLLKKLSASKFRTSGRNDLRELENSYDLCQPPRIDLSRPTFAYGSFLEKNKVESERVLLFLTVGLKHAGFFSTKHTAPKRGGYRGE